MTRATAIIAITLACLGGCTTTLGPGDTVVIPIAAILSFEPARPVEPRANEVNDKVTHLLDAQEHHAGKHSGAQALVAGR